MKKSLFILKNSVQNYSWGSKTAIAQLLGKKSPTSKPEAELWMGAHPQLPSQVSAKNGWVHLNQIIKKDPRSTLGAEAARDFQKQLPFLFKVLAAEEPLSMQTHPSLRQAQIGFKRENRLKVPLDARHRNYKDGNHKPELICAITPFWAMVGFRQPKEILKLIRRLKIKQPTPNLKILMRHLQKGNLRSFFKFLMTLNHFSKENVIHCILHAIPPNNHGSEIYAWIKKLHKKYPGDIGVLSPLILNLFKLKPGEAIFLQAGVPHTYLNGVGIEVMANSDNVLRGALTRKYVDVPELLRVLKFRSDPIRRLRPKPNRSKSEWLYRTHQKEFGLSILLPRPGKPYRNESKHGPEILLCTEGKVQITASGMKKTLKKGTSIFVGANVGSYEIKGKGKLYKAFTP